MPDFYELAPPVALFHLAVDQAHRHLPSKDFAPSPMHLVPVSKMGCECIEIEIEPITGKEWETARGQELSQGMDEYMSRLLCTRTKLKHRDDLGEGINGQPQPEDLRCLAQPGSEFVQL